MPKTEKSNNRGYSKQLIFISLIKSCVISITNNVPNKIKILKKLVNELETKLLENKLPDSLNELKIINNKEITIR